MMFREVKPIFTSVNFSKRAKIIKGVRKPIETLFNCVRWKVSAGAQGEAGEKHVVTRQRCGPSEAGVAWGGSALEMLPLMGRGGEPLLHKHVALCVFLEVIGPVVYRSQATKVSSRSEDLSRFFYLQIEEINTVAYLHLHQRPSRGALSAGFYVALKER